VGTGLAWASGMQSPEAITAALGQAGFNPPTPHISNFIDGIPFALPYLASAVPLGLANYVFDLENIESAHAAGDPYPTRKVMLVNGLASTLGAMFGNPFPVTVYVGHAAWKSIGAGTGYTLASGSSMFLVGLFGLGALLLAVIPMAAIAPILIYIGIVTCNQVVRETPKIEVPVIFICFFPWIANWALTHGQQTYWPWPAPPPGSWAPPRSPRRACTSPACRPWATAPRWPACCGAASRSSRS
jgi:AGZA family xanthine/uracil permease-like MFS transporter